MKLKPAQWLVLAMAVESLGASVTYALSRNWKIAAYWFFAAGINAVATLF